MLEFTKPLWFCKTIFLNSIIWEFGICVLTTYIKCFISKVLNIGSIPPSAFNVSKILYLSTGFPILPLHGHEAIGLALAIAVAIANFKLKPYLELAYVFQILDQIWSPFIFTPSWLVPSKYSCIAVWLFKTQFINSLLAVLWLIKFLRLFSPILLINSLAVIS